MSSCTVIQNISQTLKEKGLIDEKFNIIGNTEDVFPYIDKLNKHARTKYGVIEDLVKTKSIPSRLGASATVKVRFNHEVGKYIDEVKRNNPGKQYQKSRDFSSRNNIDDEIQNPYKILQVPITDNFLELVKYKKAQLNQIEKEIKGLNSRNNQKSKELLKEKYIDKKKLEEQIQELEDPNNDILFMYHSVFTELNSMLEDIEQDNVDYDKFDQKLQFLRGFIGQEEFSIFNVLGNDYKYDEETKKDQGYGRLQETLRKVEDKFKESKNNIINKILVKSKMEEILQNLNDKNNKDYTKARELLNQNEDYIITEEDLKTVNRDIGTFSKLLLGVDDSTSGGGLVLATQMIKEEYTSTQNSYVNYVASISDKITELKKKIKDTSFLIKKDSEGNNTLYLTNLYNNSWNLQKKEFQKSFNKFYFENNWKLKKSQYQKIARDLKNTSIVINPAKLSYFKSLMENNPEFDSRYKQYFIHNDTEMQQYEQNIRNLLGPMYDSYIKELEENIQNFDEHITETYNSNSSYKEQNIYKNNIWEYTRNLDNFDGNISSRLNIGNTSTGTEVMFNNFKSLSIIPLDKIGDKSTEYYDSNFKQEMQDSDKFKLWEEVNKLAEFISETYADNLEIQETELMLPWFEESFKSSLANEKNYVKLKSKIKENLNTFQNIFRKDTTKDTKDESFIRKNYQNEAKKRIQDLVSLYQAQGISRKEALEKASREVMSQVKEDTLLENLIAAGNLAAQHTARVMTEPNAKLMRQFLVMNNDMSANLQKKFNAWFRAHILNTTPIPIEVSSVWNDSIGNKKIYTLQEKKFKREYEKLKEQKPNFNNPITIKETINGVSYNISYDLDVDGGLIFMKDNSPISLQEYQDTYDKYIDAKLSSLGVNLNAMGIVNGLMKLKTASALGLNPISGNFNRVEGLLTNNIIDETGEYWTPGNDILSKRFLMGVNTKTYASKAKWLGITSKDEITKFKKFIEHFSSIQDKRNELEKAEDKLGFKYEQMLYDFSQGKPEFKNQGQVILNMLMDLEIEKNGEKVKFFDGKTINGIILEQDGTIFINPDFMDVIGDFNSDLMLDKYNQITTVLNRIHGNYDKNDNLLIKGTLGGRLVIQMKTWMGAHIIQRYGSMQHKGQLNVDLATQGLRQNGRHLKFLKNHPYLAGFSMLAGLSNTYGGTVLGVMLGASVAIPVITVGTIAGYAYAMKGSKTSFKANIQDTYNLAVFLREILLQSLNFLPRTLASVDVLRSAETKSDWLKNRSMNNLSEDDVNNMKAIAVELSVQLNMLALKIMLYSIASGLLGADDEDESSTTNVTHNFIQNQLTRLATSIGNWGSTPIIGMVTDAEKIGLLNDLTKILELTYRENKGVKDFLQVGAKTLGVPTLLMKGIGDGLLPFQDKNNFDVKGIQKPFKWTRDNFFLDDEDRAKKEYRKQREEIREDFKSIVTEEFTNEDDVKIILDGLMEETIGNKDKKLSYEETLEVLDNEGTLKTRDTKDKIVKKLKEKGYSNEEIQEKMIDIYSKVK